MPNERAREQAYRVIKERILAAEYAPGRALTETGLSRSLGMSRTPIRDAMIKLEEEGLVASEGRVKQVAILSAHEIREIFTIKRAVEGMVVEQAAFHRSGFHVSRLEELSARMRNFAVGNFSDISPVHPALSRWFSIDAEFHGILFDAAGNHRARKIVEDLDAQWKRLEPGVLASEDRLRNTLDQHMGLARCVMNGESERSREIMIGHLSELEGTLIGIMDMSRIPAAGES